MRGRFKVSGTWLSAIINSSRYRDPPFFVRTTIHALVLASLAPCWSTLAAQSTIDPAGKFAYGANTGWHNWRPSGSDGVVCGDFFLSGNAYSANTGWIRLGDGSPDNGWSYANDSSSDYGVNHDGAGNLSGFAYGPNTGWINFGWADPSDPNRPRIDLRTGALEGYAYGANTGWIRLGTGQLATVTLDCPDIDNDGIADAWEQRYFGSLKVADATTDLDGDGWGDLAESQADTNPRDRGDFLRIVDQTFAIVPGRLPGEEILRTSLVFTSRPTRFYRLHLGDDLRRFFEDSDLGLITPGSGDTTSVSSSLADPPERLFFRIEPVPPLKP